MYSTGEGKILRLKFINIAAECVLKTQSVMGLRDRNITLSKTHDKVLSNFARRLL